jgi:hypothetical protein
MDSALLPLRRSKTGKRTSSEIVVLLCARIRGSIGRKLSWFGMKRLVKTALPIVAETPHRNVAAAMYAYPYAGTFLITKELVQSLRIESDHHLFPDDDSGCGTAAVFIDEILNRFRVLTDVTLLERYASRREVGRGDMAWRSAGLCKDDDLLRHCGARLLL